MQRFKTVAALQKFVSYHSQIYNHFNQNAVPLSLSGSISVPHDD
jgi:hypothetical protein